MSDKTEALRILRARIDALLREIESVGHHENADREWAAIDHIDTCAFRICTLVGEYSAHFEPDSRTDYCASAEVS